MTSSCIVTISSSFVARDDNRYDCCMTNGALTAQGRAVREAATVLGQASDEVRRAVLHHVADRLDESCRGAPTQKSSHYGCLGKPRILQRGMDNARLEIE